jgi:hypothetical protein
MESQEPVPGIPGATIRRVDQLPDGLPDGVPAGPLTWAKPGQLLFAPPGIGSFLAREGVAIEFSQHADADPGLISLYLHGTARGALIHQRGELPLHAATLVPPGGDAAVAICGPSGAGKSTLGAELSRRGWTLVADDTTRVTWNGTHALAWPSRDSIKLWRDACEAAGIDVGGLERVTQRLDKYYVHVAARDQPARLGTIVELMPGAAGGAMTPGEKMALVTRNTYRPAHITALGMQREHVRIVAQAALTCVMFQLPGERALSVTALADMVEEALG